MTPLPNGSCSPMGLKSNGVFMRPCGLGSSATVASDQRCATLGGDTIQLLLMCAVTESATCLQQAFQSNDGAVPRGTALRGLM